MVHTHMFIDDDECIQEHKKALRREHSHRRETRSRKNRTRLSADLADIALPVLGGHSTIAAYISFPTELDTVPILQELTDAGTRVLVPKLGPGLRRDWAVFGSADDLRENAPGRPLEPSGDPLGEDAIAEADAVLVPAFAIDSAGYRLGRGGGWYDRALLHRRADVPVYGVIFDDERVTDELPRSDHDVPVTHIMTPTGITPIS